MPQDFRDVDPRDLRLPSRRGADPYKLQRQIARFGASSSGMPPPWVTYSPLLPLALLLFTGLYLFVLPYATRWRSRRGTPRSLSV